MIYVGQEVRINASFFYDDDDSDLVPPALIVPSSVQFNLFHPLNTLIIDEEASSDVDGKFYYLFTPEEIGEYKVVFTASFDSAEDQVVEQIFSVGDAAATPSFMDEEFTLVFATNLDPLYLDPDELLPFFPSVSAFNVAEAIHNASVKVKNLFDLNDDEDPPDYAYEYIKADVACKLSRELDDLFGSGAYSKDDFTLGDLTIKDSSGSSAKSKVNIGNASSWCELAFALEIEMKYKSTSAKPFVRGNRFNNPIPERRLPNQYGTRGVIKDTGRIDD